MQSYDILTYGLTAEETNQLQKNIPLNYSAFVTECFTDIIATPVSGIVVRIGKLSVNERDMLLDFFREIGDFSEVVILIGEISLPVNLRHKIKVFSCFELMKQQIRFIFMDAQRKQKKHQNFSVVVANTLFVLSAIRKTPGISTKKLAEKLEVSERSVQRYIETLRIAGEWIEYDAASKGWKLSVGKSVLWDDF
ncbi:HTH domain-containing protein [Clostridium sp. J1101437_171009_A5]|mgnify:FL=1|uniref:HTH domain-containing protein n=1 Tax=Eubacteriales TaxID=186802 RepID=UPI001896EA7E|nr:HTH domain-containing protein [Clostridium sp. J1101437_171009_A5]HCI0446039.1 HTH domain-containing protein [Enterococcus faecium]